ncbi:MAG TPA: shikimate kinase [Burkholderiales bacterium]|jgi:shikimate kinase|nr:shikimate kinase [Burkholderiales bacterium]
MKSDGNLFLVGLMGAGKTTVGRMVARRLKRSFYDSDHEVERRCGVGIPVIFDIEGEPGFRAREAHVIAELAALDGIVLATGGGAVLDAENRRRLAARGTVVYLHARPADLYDRVRHDRNRPLLADADPLIKLEELYAQRDPLYREVADLVVDTGNQSAQALVRQLLARLEERWKLSA